ncbi:diguanylate cyclase [Aphanothece hegewaldii CCALA 016]|uniref:Diguanylate cyclase n=1 Tax=Aphanothece hegewaldii CCALA 016 TaxID=2107694 RepID=A0A2T1LTJ1_9CHRO|nr:response regulator [Aphanothece hegewaldii]PSF34246.1 diguanylate cyclase [Aphanothece hegewaldii CCALA 016]
MKTTQSTPLILIVDDDRATRTLLKIAMEEEGYRVIEAKDGQQGLIEYQRYHPDMILLDAVMPEMDGFTCCSKLCQNDDGYLPPVLMITALDDQDSIDQAFEAGAIDYVTKPIHWAVLAQRVKRLLATNQTLQQLETLQQRVHQQQQWLQLFGQITNSVQPSDLSLTNLLKYANETIKFDRIIVDSYSTADRIESTLENILTTATLSREQITLELYKQNQDKIVAIADLIESDLPEKVYAPLVQLHTRAVLIIPMKRQDTLWGLLYIHQCHPHQWQDWEIEQFKIFGDLLMNIIAYS